MTSRTPNPVGHESRPLPLAMRPRAAAHALGISERLLWDWTRSEGLPHVRIGNVVLYPVDGVRRWLDERSNSPSASRDALA